jgi:hypothetical protein
MAVKQSAISLKEEIVGSGRFGSFENLKRKGSNVACGWPCVALSGRKLEISIVCGGLCAALSFPCTELSQFPTTAQLLRMPLIENADELQVKLARFDNMFDYYRMDDTGAVQHGVTYHAMEPDVLHREVAARVPTWAGMVGERWRDSVAALEKQELRNAVVL